MMISDKSFQQENFEKEKQSLNLQEQENLYNNFSYTKNLESSQSSVEDSEIKFNEMKPNSVYEKNGYEYRTNQEGKVYMAYGKLELKEGGRSPHQTEVGKLGLDTDEGGHLIGQRFNGPTDGFNLVPQDANLNRGEWKAMENEWASELENGHDVTVAIEPYFDAGSDRPRAFDVVWQRDKELPQYTTFENRSYKEL